MKRELYYPSKDGKTQIHAIAWLPEGKPAAVLQICHGMCEYIDRYDEFARFLTAQGFCVVGNDHLGHGASVQNADRYGYFAAENGDLTLLKDMHTLRRLMQRHFPDAPYFLLGHSLGSFLVRQYIARCGEGLTGVILTGTGTQPMGALRAGKSLCCMIAGVLGWHYRSTLLFSLSLGAYNRRFRPVHTQSDWLTKDAQIVDDFVHDPRCTFRFTLNGYYALFESIEDAQEQAVVKSIPETLPLFLVSGLDDPVGNFGKGVEAAYRRYRKTAASRDISLRLYENDRHEILNETDRRQVYADLLEWMQARM